MIGATRQHPVRRFSAAIAVLAVHALAVAGLLAAGRYVSLPREERHPDLVSWIWIPPRLAAPVTPPENARPPEITLKRADESLVVPSVTPPAATAPPSAAVTPPDAALLGDIGQSLSCTLTQLDKQSADEKARCEQKLGALQAAPAAPYAKTATEQRDEREFAEALAEKKAPPLAPCLTAGGLLDIIPVIPCIWKDLTDGYKPSNNPPGRYGDIPANEQ